MYWITIKTIGEDLFPVTGAHSDSTAHALTQNGWMRKTTPGFYRSTSTWLIVYLINYFWNRTDLNVTSHLIKQLENNVRLYWCWEKKLNYVDSGHYSPHRQSDLIVSAAAVCVPEWRMQVNVVGQSSTEMKSIWSQAVQLPRHRKWMLYSLPGSHRLGSATEAFAFLFHSPLLHSRLHFSGMEGHNCQPHLKKPWKWDSLAVLFVYLSLGICARQQCLCVCVRVHPCCRHRLN